MIKEEEEEEEEHTPHPSNPPISHRVNPHTPVRPFSFPDPSHAVIRTPLCVSYTITPLDEGPTKLAGVYAHRTT